MTDLSQTLVAKRDALHLDAAEMPRSDLDPLLPSHQIMISAKQNQDIMQTQSILYFENNDSFNRMKLKIPSTAERQS